MMKKMIRGLAAAVCVMGLPGCQEQAWDDHYAVGADGGQSLMQLIDGKPELSRFTQVVRENGMDALLSSSQTFTVFAPDNEAMAALNLESDTLEQFLYNHICRYVYTQGDVADTDEGTLRVKMLNGKYQNLEEAAGVLTFGKVAAVTGVAGGANGVLNTVDQVVPFYRNLYEELCEGEGTDSVGNYLAAMDEYTFLPEMSTVIGVDGSGQTLYDSVFDYRNDWMASYGDLYKEDSVYTVLAPSNTAWDRQLAKVRPYFRTYGAGEIEMPTSGLRVTGNFETGTPLADSLREAHTRQAMLQDMVFRKSLDVEHPDGDSIISTSGHVFHSPWRLFADAEQRTASNGQLFVADELKFDPTESWHTEIRVEAEEVGGYATQFCGSVSARSVENFPQFAGQVSENGFLYLTPTGLAFQRNTVRFALPNTLSGKYNIYVVMLPASAVDTASVHMPDRMRSTKLNFYLTYVHEDGRLREDAVIATPSDFDGGQTPVPIDAAEPPFVTDAWNVDKILVAKNFKFPYANFTASPFASSLTETPTTAYLRVECAVRTTQELAVYEKNMRIDCVILEPVN